jgi:hypothetical protein
MTENEMQIEKTDDPNPKTPYSHPQLVVYGDIQEITLSTLIDATDRDNAGPGTNRNKTRIPNSTPRPDDPKPTPTKVG